MTELKGSKEPNNIKEPKGREFIRGKKSNDNKLSIKNKKVIAGIGVGIVLIIAGTTTGILLHKHNVYESNLKSVHALEKKVNSWEGEKGFIADGITLNTMKNTKTEIDKISGKDFKSEKTKLISQYKDLEERATLTKETNDLFEKDAIKGSKVTENLPIKDENVGKDLDKKVESLNSKAKGNNEEFYKTLSKLNLQAKEQLDVITKVKSTFDTNFKDNKLKKGLNKKDMESLKEDIDKIKKQSIKDEYTKKYNTMNDLFKKATNDGKVDEVKEEVNADNVNDYVKNVVEPIVAEQEQSQGQAGSTVTNESNGNTSNDNTSNDNSYTGNDSYVNNGGGSSSSGGGSSSSGSGSSSSGGGSTSSGGGSSSGGGGSSSGGGSESNGGTVVGGVVVGEWNGVYYAGLGNSGRAFPTDSEAYSYAGDMGFDDPSITGYATWKVRMAGTNEIWTTVHFRRGSLD